MKIYSKQTKAPFILTVALSQLLAFAPLPSMAADTAVRIAGQSVFSIPAGQNRAAAESRAAAIQKALDNALVAAQTRQPSAVKVVYFKGLPVVTLSGYRIVTIDASTAKAFGTTPAVLATRWSTAIKKTLSNQESVDHYVAQLTGADNDAPAYTPSPSPAPQATAPQTSAPIAQTTTPVQRGRIVYVPAGMVLPITLTTGISSEVAQPGDRVEATVNQTINLENGMIPAGSVVVGQVTQTDEAKRLGRSGELGFKFTTLRTPDGAESPITAHIIGSVSKYAEQGGDTSDVVKGETTKNKVESAAIRSAVGAGAGALLGTAIGAIAGHGSGAGKGAWSGAAIGGGLGLADALLLRKGANVQLKSGEQMKLQLDAPAQLAGYNTGNM